MKWAPVADEIYRQYLADVTAIDLSPAGDRPGINMDWKKAVFLFSVVLVASNMVSDLLSIFL